jgi:YbbR domain-containing protein
MTASPPLPPNPPEHPHRRWSLKAALTERLGLKVTALLVSVLLWLVVSARQPTQSYVRVLVQPRLDSSLVLREQPSQLEALVVGRAADILKLYANPPVVRRVIGGDAPDTLVLDVQPSDVRVPAELTDQVRVLDVQPRSVTLRFETGATRRVPVEVADRVTIQPAVAEPWGGLMMSVEPNTVLITGSRRAVRRIRSVKPYSLTIAEADTLPHVADLDTTGLGVRVSPSQVKITIRCKDLGLEGSESRKCP